MTPGDAMTIGQASKQSGVSAKMIRHYEGIGLIPAAHRGTSGYRLYRAEDVHTLRFIGRARSLGFPIATIVELLALWRDGGRSNADVRQVAQRHADALRRKMAGLAEMAAALDRLVRACSGDGRPECPILDGLAEAAAGQPSIVDEQAPKMPHRHGRGASSPTHAMERSTKQTGWR